MPDDASTRNRTLSVNPAVLTFQGHPAGFVISPGFLFSCKEDSGVPRAPAYREGTGSRSGARGPSQPFCSKRRSTRCLCTGPGFPSCHGTSIRAVHTHTVEMKPGEHFQTMLLIKRSSFLRQVFPSSYLNRKYFFILDLPKSPKQMGKSNPSPEAGMELGGQAFVGLPVCGLGAFPLPFLAHTAKSASVMCQMACHCTAGWFQRPPFPPLLMLSPGKHPLPLSEPLTYLAGSTAEQEQGNDQHQHCQHFEPSLLRKPVTLPTSSP